MLTALSIFFNPKNVNKWDGGKAALTRKLNFYRGSVNAYKNNLRQIDALIEHFNAVALDDSEAPDSQTLAQPTPEVKAMTAGLKAFGKIDPVQEIKDAAVEADYLCREVAQKGYFLLYTEIEDTEESKKYGYPVIKQPHLGYIGYDSQNRLYWANTSRYTPRVPQFNLAADALNSLLSTPSTPTLT